MKRRMRGFSWYSKVHLSGILLCIQYLIVDFEGNWTQNCIKPWSDIEILYALSRDRWSHRSNARLWGLTKSEGFWGGC
jgi:hypothetical protein